MWGVSTENYLGALGGSFVGFGVWGVSCTGVCYLRLLWPKLQRAVSVNWEVIFVGVLTTGTLLFGVHIEAHVLYQ